MRIHFNFPAEGVNTKLGVNQKRRAKSTEKLSSGRKLNRSSDDSAGIAISEKMRAQIRGLNQASRNIQDGMSYVQCADGGMQEVQNLLQRGRELVNQALSDTNSHEVDRPAIQAELDQLCSEVDSMAKNTEFNGMKVLDGGGGYLVQSSALAAPLLSPASAALAPATPTTLAAPLSPPSGNAAYYRDVTTSSIVITGNGVLDLNAVNALGDIRGWEIKVQASNVHLTQTPGTQFELVEITCDTSTNLFIENLNIFSWGSNIMTFRGGSSTLNLIGTNTFEGQSTYSGEIEGAVVQINSGANLEIKNASGYSGKLDVLSNARYSSDAWHAAIGSGYEDTGGSITISSGEILARVNAGGTSVGPAIGGYRFGDINITGGKVTAEITASAATGAAIGGSIIGDINISGGDVTARYNQMSSTYMGQACRAIGAQYFDSINISGGKVRAELNSVGGWIFGAAIGGGGTTLYPGIPTSQIINLTGGEIWTNVDDYYNIGPAIGSMSGTNGPKILVDGAIIHVDGSVIGARNSVFVGSDFNPGEITFTDKNDINAIFDKIYPNIWNGTSPIRDASGTPLYRVEIQGATFEPGASVSYTIGGTAYSSKMSEDGKLYLYQPISDHGAQIKISANEGREFEATLSIGNNHDNVVALTQTAGAPALAPGRDYIAVQSGANSGDSMMLSSYDCTARSLGVERLYTQPRGKAEQSLTALSNAIDKVSAYRADAGAKQNRMEHALRNAENAAVNLAEAESRIRDADMAKEMVEFVRADILTQAATAILAQANQMPEMVLQLLG